MSKTLLKHEISKEYFLKLPHSPGIYIFWNYEKPIYVGKAINLKNRLNSYLGLNLETKTESMMKDTVFVSFIKVTSELEALLLEASLINKYKPKFNIALKDDKHPLYIKITKDKYPIITTARKMEKNGHNLDFFGPFPSSKNVKYILKIIRKVFPYAEHKPSNKPCLYYQLGLCNPCPSIVEKLAEIDRKPLQKKYKENIKSILGVLQGKTNKIKNSFQNQMKIHSDRNEFEESIYYKNLIDKLNYITQPITEVSQFVSNPNLVEDLRKAELMALRLFLRPFVKTNYLKRIECYDVAHLMGTNPTASMVVLIDGEPDKTYYRRFKINEKKGNDDVLSLTEVATRRKKHLNDWGVPDLIVVDGGKPQLNAFYKVFSDYKIPIIGLAKRYEKIIIKDFSNIGKKEFVELVASGKVLTLLQRIRNEAHRFARSYHHKLVSKTLIRK